MKPSVASTDGNVYVIPETFFGHVQIVATHRWEGNTLIVGGYSITYDQHGKEVSRTPDTENARLVCPDEATKQTVTAVLRCAGIQTA